MVVMFTVKNDGTFSPIYEMLGHNSTFRKYSYTSQLIAPLVIQNKKPIHEA